MCFFLKKLIWFLQLKKNEYCIEFYNELKIDNVINVPLMPLCVLNSPSHVLQETRTKHVLS